MPVVNLPDIFLKDAKKKLRIETKERTEQFLRGHDRSAVSQGVCACLESLPEAARADIVFAYIPAETEVDCLYAVRNFLSAGKKVAVPKVVPGTSRMEFCFLSESVPVGAQLERGSFGIAEPKAELQKFFPEDCSGGAADLFMIVPGVAFSRDGARLGHGRGFYDRYIERMRRSSLAVFLCGVCFECQMYESIPVDEHDVPMDAVVF